MLFLKSIYMHAIHRCEHNLLSSLFASINALSLVQLFVHVFDVMQVADEEDTDEEDY